MDAMPSRAKATRLMPGEGAEPPPEDVTAGGEAEVEVERDGRAESASIDPTRPISSPAMVLREKPSPSPPLTAPAEGAEEGASLTAVAASVEAAEMLCVGGGGSVEAGEAAVEAAEEEEELGGEEEGDHFVG